MDLCTLLRKDILANRLPIDHGAPDHEIACRNCKQRTEIADCQTGKRKVDGLCLSAGPLLQADLYAPRMLRELHLDAIHHQPGQIDNDGQRPNGEQALPQGHHCREGTCNDDATLQRDCNQCVHGRSRGHALAE